MEKLSYQSKIESELKSKPTINKNSKYLAGNNLPIHQRYEDLKRLKQKRIEKLQQIHAKPDEDSI